MLFPAGKSWALDFFLRRGWLVERRGKVRRRPGSWNLASTVPAECLEERVLLSTITVTSTADSGSGSLRNAIANANSGDTIQFDVSTNGTPIQLTSGELAISSSLTITGNGAANTIIDAQQSSRIFDITSAAGNVTLGGMTLENGKTTAAGRSSAGGAGGAIFSASTATLALSADVLTGNSTTGNQASGGAIFANGPVTIVNSTISGNSTSGPNAAYGGAIYSAAAVSVLGSTLSGNSTAGIHSYGGALFTFGDIKLTNSTVTGNRTTGAGSNAGAIWTGAALTAINSTVAQNSASSGQTGGIYQWIFDGTPAITLKNTIVAQNTDNGTAPDLRIIGGANVTVTHSLIGDNTGTGLTEGHGGGNLIGGPTNGLIDPLLGALADNGGPTQTMELLTGSPAIDAGSAADAVDPNTSATLTSDQRGAPFVRTFGTEVDMGACERQFALIVTSTADTLNVAYDPAHLTLRDALALANVNVGPDAITFASAINGTPIDLTLGELSISEDVTITGNGAANTIIDAQQNSRIFLIDSGAGDVTLSSMTLQNGKTSSSGGAILSGSSGALAIVGSAIINSTITGDHVAGGAISDSGGSVAITNSTLTGNSTTGQFAGGGAVYTSTGDVSISGSTLSGNSTGNNYSPGGAISTQHGQVTVTNSTLTGNSTAGTGANGGAVFAYRGTVTAVNSTIARNHATNATGGGVYAYLFTGNKNGSGTTSVTAAPSDLSVIDFVNGSGKGVHLVLSGTTACVFIDSTSHMSLGTFSDSTHATTPAFPGDVATIAANLSTVTWTDGSVWTKTAATTAITVTSFKNGSNAAVYLIQNGTTQLAFVDRLNHISLGTMHSPMTALADLYPGDLVTISGSFVKWQDGALWTRTTVSPLTTRFIDSNGAVSHVQLTSPTTLLGLDGPLQGLTGTRVDNRIRWSNGDVWTMTNFDALHALFQMGLGYP